MSRRTHRSRTGEVRIAVAMALVVLVAGLCASDAAANCGINKFFRSGGSDSTENVRIIPAYAGQLPGTEIGRWWDSGNAALSSNLGPNDGTCPSSNWWTALMNGNMQIEGILDSTGCVGYSGCPGLEMTVVVEDYGPTGSPGIGDTAYYIGFRVDDTPASLRRYDYGRTDNGEKGNSLFPFLEFPEVRLTSAQLGAHFEFTYDLPDQAEHVHTAFGASDDPLPTDSVVAEWQLLWYEGHWDPGRDRSHWTLLQTTPYVPGGTSRFASVPRIDFIINGTDLFLAFGIGFNGGDGGTIDSELVGSAAMFEMQILADPDEPVDQHFDRTRPGTETPRSQPRSAGGRR